MTLKFIGERKSELFITILFGLLTIAGSIFASALSVQSSIKDEISDNKVVHQQFEDRINNVNQQVTDRLNGVEKVTEYLTKRDNLYHDLMIEFRINLKRICTQLNVRYEQIVDDSKLTKNN